MIQPYGLFMLLGVALAAGFAQAPGSGRGSAKPGIQKSAFGTMPDGQTVALYTLTNRPGITIKI